MMNFLIFFHSPMLSSPIHSTAGISPPKQHWWGEHLNRVWSLRRPHSFLPWGPSFGLQSSSFHRLALTFHEGSSGCPVPAAPFRITTKSSSLGLTTDPRSCILLTTSGVPVLLWSPGSHSFQVSPFWQFSASAVTFLSAYSLKTDVLQDHLLVCLCIDLSIVYLLPESSTHPHSFHHP